MKRTQKTKRALIASVVSMAMCCALLLGTTFAWFTDSVTNTGNVITAGNLKIDATAYDLGNGGVSVTIPGVNNDSSFTFENTGLDLKSDTAKNTPIISEPLWEPGQSNAKLLEIKNSGNLATNIRLDFDVKDDGLQDALWFDFVQVSPQQGQFTKRDMSDLRTLAQSMVFTLKQNESMRFVLVYGMEEEAGNEYQGKAFSADVTVMATQAPVEIDGFGNSQYDAAANGDPDYPEWATGGTTQVTKPSEGWAETTTLTVPGVTVSVPKEAIALNAQALKLSVIAKAEQPSGITVPVNEGQEAKWYEVALTGISDENQQEIAVKLQIGKALQNVKLYQNGSEVTNAQYDYDTGIVTFTTTSFGSFAVVSGSLAVSTTEELTSAAANGQSVYLTDNIVVDESLAFQKEAQISLNGHDLTLNKEGGMANGSISTSTSLTVEGNGTIHGALVANSGGKLTIRAGDNFTVDSNFVTGAAISASSNTIVDIDGGTYIGRQKGNGVINAMGTEVTVRNATVNVGVDSMSQSCGIVASNAKNTLLENVTVNAKYGVAVKLNNAMEGHATIVGGHFTTDRVASGWDPNDTIQYAGTLDISDATIDRVGVGIKYRKTWPLPTEVVGLTQENVTFNPVNEAAKQYQDVDYYHY